MRIVVNDLGTLKCTGYSITFKKSGIGGYGWINPYAVHVPGTTLPVKRSEGRK